MKNKSFLHSGYICLTFVVAAVILLPSCGGSNNNSDNKVQDGDEITGNISISGAFALYPLAVKW